MTESPDMVPLLKAAEAAAAVMPGSAAMVLIRSGASAGGGYAGKPDMVPLPKAAEAPAADMPENLDMVLCRRQQRRWRWRIRQERSYGGSSEGAVTDRSAATAVLQKAAADMHASAQMRVQSIPANMLKARRRFRFGFRKASQHRFERKPQRDQPKQTTAAPRSRARESNVHYR